MCFSRNGQWRAHWVCDGCVVRGRCPDHPTARVCFTDSLWAASLLMAPKRPWIPNVAYIAPTESYESIRRRPDGVRATVALRGATPVGEGVELATGGPVIVHFGGDGMLFGVVVRLADHTHGSEIVVTPIRFTPPSPTTHTVVVSIPEFFFEVRCRDNTCIPIAL